MFVNFRVGDGQDAAGLIDRKLVEVFGPDVIFRSSRSFDAGVQLSPELITAAAECRVMIVIIGPNWLTAADDAGTKLSAPGDWVRLEVELALRAGAAVIPVLVDGTAAPGPADLPPAIRELADQPHIRLHQRDTEHGLVRIVDEVRAQLVPGDAAAPLRGAGSSPIIALPVTGRSTDIRFGPAEIDGQYYSDSVFHRCTLYCNDPRGSVDFTLGRRYRTLEVVAGVLDDATEPDQTGVFQVVLDSVRRKQVTVRRGEPRALRIDVTDALRVRLAAYRPGSTDHPMMAGLTVTRGVSRQLPELAWGNPTVYP